MGAIDVSANNKQVRRITPHLNLDTLFGTCSMIGILMQDWAKIEYCVAGNFAKPQLNKNLAFKSCKKSGLKTQDMETSDLLLEF